jgi:hypothetical protein
MANAARDQRETTLALRGDVEEPGADASGPLALVTTQQNAVTRSDPFEALEPPKEFSRDDVPRIEGESESQYLERWYIFMAAKYEYALQHSRLEHNARLAHWREKEKALDDLETARKEIARLNEVLQNDLRSRAAAAELAQKNRPRVVGDVAADEAKLVMQACECPVKEAEDRYIRLQCDFLVTQRQIEMLGTLERTAQEQNHLTRSGLGGGDAGRPGPGHYVEIAVLKGTVGKLEIKLAAAQKEITRLNEALQDELRAQRDSAVAELAQKKRRRVDDDAAANQ